MRLRFDFPHPSSETTPQTSPIALEFDNPRRRFVAWTPEEVGPALRAAEAEALAGAWVAGFLCYEAASAFDASLVTHPPANLPLAWFAVFDRPSGSVALAANDGIPAASAWTPRVSAEAYFQGVAAVKEAIAAGDSYQANYTLQLDTHWQDDCVWTRYTALLRAHRPRFAACLDLDDVVVLSLSPELLLHRRGRRVTTAPMKGTASRGRWLEEDEERARTLARSEKNRAENVMIVDLARNDLGRICELGTIEVPSLFEVQRYRTAWQMVSTVTGTLREDVGLTEALCAMFPAGSITGAPKVSTMRLIRRIEPNPRGIYCGAIGLIAPGGDAIFNVAIRTAVFDRRSAHVSLGVGGGITWDSLPVDELAEAHLKATFLDVPPSFSLLETMRFDGTTLRRRQRHLDRLLASAAYFDVPVSVDRLDRAIAARTAQWGAGERRVRMIVAADGSVEITSTPLDVVPAPARVALSPTPVDSGDPFLCHKTTHRTVYESRRVARPDVFDVLLVNERGELTEFTIGNLVLELDGRLVTPHRRAGLLAGVFRDELLSQGALHEQDLEPSDLDRATAVWLINSVREWVPVTLVA